MNVKRNLHKQMANNFVKWWKTKFLNGYRQFTADGHESRISDTEDLLGNRFGDKESVDRSRASSTTPLIDSQNFNGFDPSTLPPSQPQSPQQNSTPKQHLNLEEFSCDVSLEGGIDKKGQERQEFSFTLYDFDGYGKITKDDIAGLVTTIYEALGSSVKVPHYGSKTIRVKLTVSPDQRKHVSATVINEKENKPEDKADVSSDRVKRDLNVTIQNKSSCKTENKKVRPHYCCNHEEVANVSDDSSDALSQISDITSEDEGECLEEQFSRCHKTRQRYHKKSHSKNVSKEYTKKTDGTREKKQKRSGSLQRQELLEIIQANMDKNNFGLQNSRKQFKTHVSDKSEVKHQKCQKNLPTLQYLADIVDPTHFYVDLAAFQNTTNLPQTPCQYNKLIDAVMCVSNKKQTQRKHNSCRRHHRLRTQDFTSPLPCQALPASKELKTTKTPSHHKSTENETKKIKRSVKKFPQIVLGHTSSPHHLRHRNRQEDQARAMAQVVRWLEQEFSSNLHTSDKKSNSTSRSTGYEKHSHTSSSQNCSVERHEHHHVHEHIHHHYHHYQETPIVV